MSDEDLRGEIYRGWLIVLMAHEDMYFYEIHSPEGYINRNLSPCDTTQEAIANGRQDIDAVIKIFDGVDVTSPSTTSQE